MDPASLLSHLRCGVMAVDQLGTITQVEGASSGLIGYRPGELIGRNVLDFVAPEDVETVAEIFATGDDALQILRVPTPFSIGLVTAEGEVEAIDVVPTGVSEEAFTGWVMTLTARSVQPVSNTLMDTIAAGGTSVDALQSVVDRFELDTKEGLHCRTFGVLAGPAGVKVLSTEASPLIEALQDTAIEVPPEAWLPSSKEGLAEVAVEALPGPLAEIAGAEGFVAVQLGWVTIGDRWAAVAWFVNDLDLGTMRGNAVLIRRSILRLLLLGLQRDWAEETLRHAAFHDPLTGLANRSGLSRAVDELGDHVPVAVLYVDVDGFKGVNDRHGHRVGDLVLGEIADRLRSACRPEDVVARMGGDEFTVLLAGVERRGAVTIAERILEQVSRPLRISGGPATVTVTVGLSGPRPQGALNDLMDEADRAMLVGKRRRDGGAGRVVVADEARAVGPNPARAFE